MKITIISVGKWKSSPEAEIFAEYKKRMKWKIDLVEVEEKNEARLAQYIPDGAYKIVLDEKGRQFTSKEFAAHLDKLRVQGRSDISFLIGGADGHDDSTKKNADLLLSLGSLTWPHMLVRAMLAEQLYRAFSISSGHPYHRE